MCPLTLIPARIAPPPPRVGAAPAVRAAVVVEIKQMVSRFPEFPGFFGVGRAPATLSCVAQAHTRYTSSNLGFRVQA